MNDITTLIATTVTTGVHVRPSAYILPALVTIGIIVLIIRKTRGEDEPDTYTNPYSLENEHTVDNADSADNAGNDGYDVGNGDSAGSADGVDSTEND